MYPSIIWLLSRIFHNHKHKEGGYWDAQNIINYFGMLLTMTM